MSSTEHQEPEPLELKPHPDDDPNQQEDQDPGARELHRHHQQSPGTRLANLQHEHGGHVNPYRVGSELRRTAYYVNIENGNRDVVLSEHSIHKERLESIRKGRAVSSQSWGYGSAIEERVHAGRTVHKATHSYAEKQQQFEHEWELSKHHKALADIAEMGNNRKDQLSRRTDHQEFLVNTAQRKSNSNRRYTESLAVDRENTKMLDRLFTTRSTIRSSNAMAKKEKERQALVKRMAKVKDRRYRDDDESSDDEWIDEDGSDDASELSKSKLPPLKPKRPPPPTREELQLREACWDVDPHHPVGLPKDKHFRTGKNPTEQELWVEELCNGRRSDDDEEDSTHKEEDLQATQGSEQSGSTRKRSKKSSRKPRTWSARKKRIERYEKQLAMQISQTKGQGTPQTARVFPRPPELNISLASARKGVPKSARVALPPVKSAQKETDPTKLQDMGEKRRAKHDYYAAGQHVKDADAETAKQRHLEAAQRKEHTELLVASCKAQNRSDFHEVKKQEEENAALRAKTREEDLEEKRRKRAERQKEVERIQQDREARKAALAPKPPPRRRSTVASTSSSTPQRRKTNPTSTPSAEKEPKPTADGDSQGKEQAEEQHQQTEAERPHDDEEQAKSKTPTPPPQPKPEASPTPPPAEEDPAPVEQAPVVDDDEATPAAAAAADQAPHSESNGDVQDAAADEEDPAPADEQMPKNNDADDDGSNAEPDQQPEQPDAQNEEQQEQEVPRQPTPPQVPSSGGSPRATPSGNNSPTPPVDDKQQVSAENAATAPEEEDTVDDAPNDAEPQDDPDEKETADPVPDDTPTEEA